MAEDAALSGWHTDPSGVTNLNGQSKYYLVQILSSRYGLVNAWLPDQFAMNLTHSWRNLISGGAPEIASQVSEWFTGKGLHNLYLTAKVWTGTESLAFNLPLHFVARKSSQNEVIKPIKQLMKMSMAVRANSMQVYTPSVSVQAKAKEAMGFGADTHSDHITLYIGNYLRIPDIYIESVNATFHGLLNKEGEPMFGDVNISCKTVWMPTANDIDGWLPDNKSDIRDRPNYQTGHQANLPGPDLGGPAGPG